MAKCKNCNWFALDKEHKGECFCCLPLGNDIEATEAEIDRDCPMFSQMSNADRIRAMTDNELAEIIPCPYIRDDYDECKFGWHEQTQTCEQCKLEWLKSEAKE